MTTDTKIHPAVWALAAAVFLFHLASAEGYGIFRDELYYLACGARPGWGYVDHPPLIGWLAWLIRHTLGTSLLAIRLLPAAAAAGTVLLVGRIGSELGGRGWAQAVAALCVATAPVLLALHSILSMNAFDVLLWAAAGAVLVRLERTGDSRLWLWFGAIAGIGLLNKLSFLFLGFGVAVGLVAARRWRHLASPRLWVGAGIAALLALPYGLWQMAHGWPTAEFMHNAATFKNVDLSPLAFLGAQLRDLNPIAAPVWIAGLVGLLASRRLAAGRVLGWAWVAIFIVMAVGSAKPYYLAASFPWLFAAGGVVVEAWTADRRRWLRWAAPVAIAASAAAIAPLAKPLLSEDSLVAYQARLGMAPGTDEHHELGRLGQYFADMHGWREMAESVARAVERLSAEDRARACVFGRNYGETGAVELFGPELGLPPAVSGHNSYWLWGPGECSGEVVVVIGGEREQIEAFFARVEPIGSHDAADAMPYERNLTIWLAREPKQPLAEAWPELKSFS